MTINQISAQKAKELLDSDAGYIYLDVRSEHEFKQQHAACAYNIPVMQMNPQTGTLQSNPDFLSVVEANFSKEAKLLLGCAAGQRSNAAAAMLKQNDYSNLNNIQGGFFGMRDMVGNIRQAGWQQLNFPTKSGDGDEKGYQSMVKNKK